jgi:pimeloyl-ACP methyl ester carboxylesterase
MVTIASHCASRGFVRSVPVVTTSTTNVVTPDGRILGVESGGDPSGPAVLVHSGTPGSRHIFGPVLRDAEARGIHIIKYDRPGYGRSTAQPGRSVADCAQDVRAIADAFGLERVAIWGASGGGPYALACAALLPDLVTAAASLAAPAPYGAEGLDYFAGMGQDNVESIRTYLDNPSATREQSRQDRDQMLATTPEGLHEGFGSLLSPADAAWMTLDIAADVVADIRLGLEPGDEGWWDDGVAQLSPWGFDLADIAVPVQVWHGAQDRFVPFQHGQWLAAHTPGAEPHLTDTDGHVTLINGRVPEVHEWLLQHL